MTTLTRMEIRDLRSLDWPEVAAIYEDGIRTGNATFETGVPSWEEWDAAHTELRLVAELDGRTAGWAALSAVLGSLLLQRRRRGQRLRRVVGAGPRRRARRCSTS